jgi:tryptophanyl-tRNA synthetase
MTMVTDPARRYRNDPGHPEICNVWKLHRFFKPEWVEEEARRCRAAQIGCVEDKEILAESINKALEPFRQRRAEFAAKPAYIAELMDSGAKRAHAIAKETIAEVKERMRLLPGNIHD